MVLADFLPQFYHGRVCKYAIGCHSLCRRTAARLLHRCMDRYMPLHILKQHEARNFELLSDDEDDTRAGIPSPHYTSRRTFDPMRIFLSCNRSHTRWIFSGIRFQTCKSLTQELIPCLYAANDMTQGRKIGNRCSSSNYYRLSSYYLCGDLRTPRFLRGSFM
ncbi:hypothetical protein AVEN_9104-1 [Araneus ventricosus]|uniref:Uncharacterized protein n=1 Tax=Araneus ventricosus TaxID=182803 RepID=A0A4Y2R9V6_ARAVE|nr:hypothetical protein AVEN_9104-1 [Araneus ventricosus]